jgi:O-antigen ligase
LIGVMKALPVPALPADPAEGLGPALLALVAVGIGATIGLLAGGERWVLAAAAATAICLAVPMLIRPASVPMLLVLALMVVDEFPNLLGEVPERSLRTPFYSTSLGLPLLYAPDLLIALATATWLLRRVLQQRQLGLPIDPVMLALMGIALAMATAVGMSISLGNPLAPVVIQYGTGLEIEVNERALRLIAVFQFKMLATVFSAYVAARLWLNEPGSRDGLWRCLGLGIAINIVAGLARLAAHPSLPAGGVPLFVDSAASCFFALFICHAVAAWSFGQLTPKRALVHAAASGVLALFILMSFRRSVWGAGLLSALVLLVLIPAGARIRLLACGTVGIAMLGLLVVLSPLRELVLDAVLQRIAHTSSEDLSTVYRVAITAYMAEHYQNIPFFGHGLKPLWNEIVVLGRFRDNVENIHSLYFWWFLRTGWFGLLLGAAAACTVMFQAARNIASARLADDKVLAVLLLLVFIMLGFVGLLHPIYGQSRFMLATGLALALTSRLREALAAAHTASAISSVAGEE